jgi:hydroxyacylglutathione hydrolase
VIRETFPVGPLHCNCTVLGDEATGEATVVDPGGDLQRIEAVLTKHRLHVTQIVVTHAHLDHIAGAHTLRQLTGAPILYNQHDLPQLQLMPEQAAWMGVAVPTVMAPDASAEDGMVLKVGSTLVDVLHTPGHTQGSICLHLPAENLLLAGDTLFRDGIGRTDFPGGNLPQLMRSITTRLLHLPECNVVVPGHGAETTLGRELERNPFLQNV